MSELLSRLLNLQDVKAKFALHGSKHDYRLEPNATFTPDGKSIVFRSNMHGATHVYAVQVEAKQE